MSEVIDFNSIQLRVLKLLLNPPSSCSIQKASLRESCQLYISIDND